MHINMEGVFVEEDGGEIIVTNLIARSFPVIRYKLGDYVELEDESFECPCGMRHRVIKNIMGRVGKVVYGVSNTYPSLVFYNIFKNLTFQNNLELNYQAVQNAKGEITLRIQQNMNNEQETLLIKELKKYFKEDITVKILTNQSLRNSEGKFSDFISTVE
jgi:phenylacetate-CoA ligase